MHTRTHTAMPMDSVARLCACPIAGEWKLPLMRAYSREDVASVHELISLMFRPQVSSTTHAQSGVDAALDRWLDHVAACEKVPKGPFWLTKLHQHGCSNATRRLRGGAQRDADGNGGDGNGGHGGGGRQWKKGAAIFSLAHNMPPLSHLVTAATLLSAGALVVLMGFSQCRRKLKRGLNGRSCSMRTY